MDGLGREVSQAVNASLREEMDRLFASELAGNRQPGDPEPAGILSLTEDETEGMSTPGDPRLLPKWMKDLAEAIGYDKVTVSDEVRIETGVPSVGFRLLKSHDEEVDGEMILRFDEVELLNYTSPLDGPSPEALRDILGDIAKVHEDLRRSRPCVAAGVLFAAPIVNFDDWHTDELDSRMSMLLQDKPDGYQEQVGALKDVLARRYDQGDQHAAGCFCDRCDETELVD